MSGQRLSVDVVEVCPRDGFQSVGPFIATELKIELIRALYAAGLRRIEATSFVSPAAVPQLADAAEILAAVRGLDGLDVHVLTPTARHAERALAAGAEHLAFVLSASEWHNLSNVRRSRAESIKEYKALVALLPSGARLRLNIATAFDCPRSGRIEESTTLDLLSQLVSIAPNAEVALCDTTGRATPKQVEELFQTGAKLFAHISWAFHGHDTYGMGAANAFAAYRAGVEVIDASCAGLGGCPFAPGATGNVATEDIVWMFHGMGVSTGVNLDHLIHLANRITTLPGALIGGRVRTALAASSVEGQMTI